MKLSILVATVVVAGCAAEQTTSTATEVGVTVLPVTSAAPRAPLAHDSSAGPEPASPERNRELAERYFTEARSLMGKGQVLEACDLFQRSLEADPAIGTMLNLADCNEKLGNIPAACSAYRDVEVQAKASGQDARGELARARAEKLGCR